MVLCGKDCIPCCDFCIGAIQGEMEVNGKKVTSGPVGCKKHSDEEHQKIARSCGYCDDFHCFHVNEIDEDNSHAKSNGN